MVAVRSDLAGSNPEETNDHQKYELTAVDYSIDRKALVGAGSYGQIYIGNYKHNNEKVAIKEITLNKKIDKPAIENEYKIMCLLDNASGQNSEKAKCIVEFFGYSIANANTYHLIFEYMNSGTLQHWIYCSAPVSDTWKEGYPIVQGIIKGLSYIHQKDVIHCDIKPDNILLTRNLSTQQLEAKISDFGLSYKLSSSPNSNKGIRGTFLYMAPEIMKGTTACSKESDMFSFGRTLWEMSEQKEPFEKIDSREAFIKYIDQVDCAEPVSKSCPPKIAHLITLCLARKPSDRPTANNVLEELKSDINTMSKRP